MNHFAFNPKFLHITGIPLNRLFAIFIFSKYPMLNSDCAIPTIIICNSGVHTVPGES